VSYHYVEYVDAILDCKYHFKVLLIIKLCDKVCW